MSMELYRRRCVGRGIGGVLLASAGVGLGSSALASPVYLDLSDGLNYDAWVSEAEAAEAISYDPPEDWNAGNRRTVNAIFGQNGLWNATSTFAWQDQISSGVGLPTDG